MEMPPQRSGPPACVALVARTHWVVGGVILVSIGLLRWIVEKYPVEFTTRTYAITGALAALYGITGTLVWFGLPGGRFLSRVCSLIYLARPNLGSHLWDIMDSAEFKTHFGVKVPPRPL
jgi:hypothetical protein